MNAAWQRAFADPGPEGRRKSVVRLCLLALALALALAGCGTGADRAQVRTAAERFSAAFERHDGAAACAQLTTDLRAQIAKDESEPTCAKAVPKLSLHGGRLLDVRVYATSGRARLAGGDTLFLGETKDGWRIEAVGCHPRRHAPYDCAEQA
jgi:hypothetical protein